MLLRTVRGCSLGGRRGASSLEPCLASPLAARAFPQDASCSARDAGFPGRSGRGLVGRLSSLARLSSRQVAPAAAFAPTTPSLSRLRVGGLALAASQREVASLAEAVEEEEEEEMVVEERRTVFVRNGEVVPSPHATEKEFITSAPRGAYTSARTVHQHSIFEFEAHVARMAESSRHIMAKEAGFTATAAHADIKDPALLRPIIVENVRAGMLRFAEGAMEGEEAKVTLLITWGDQGYDVQAMVVPLGKRPEQPVKVMIGGKPRADAVAKDIEWAKARKSLEQSKPEDVNEVVLMDDSGHLFEGTQTNFYAVQGGKVVTAGEGILVGTVRKMILEVCEREGIPVDLRAPKLADIQDWQGAFVSSTSRLLLPVGQVIMPGGEAEHDFGGKDPLVARLESLVLRDFEQMSSRVA